MAELTEKTVESIAALVRAGGSAVPVGNFPFAVIPKDAQLVSLEEHIFNNHTERPERLNEVVKVLDAESFIEYYRSFADEKSRVFAYEPESQITALLDYHESPTEPRWCEHRLDLRLVHSPEWLAWKGKNDVALTQMQFAEFLEQYASDITVPSPAAIIDVCRDLQGKTEVEFGGGARTQNGQIQFRYSETIRAQVGGGTVEVPETFTIQIPVYLGGEAVPIQALLRFRFKDQKLVLWYSLVRADEAKRTAFFASRQLIADELGAVVLNGKVEVEG